MNIGFQLYQLQCIDSELDSAKKRILEIEDSINTSPEVDRAQELVDESHASLKIIQSEYDVIEIDIEAKRIKKTQSEENLYGGKIKNPKELQDLQLEISSLSKILSELDDNLIEKLIQLEKAQEILKNRTTDLNHAVSMFETKKSMLTAELDKLNNHIKSLHEKQNSLLMQIEKNALETYQRLRKAKNGFAVAQLQDNSCSACGSSLTASQCQQARSSANLFFCPNCGRIVYGS